MNIDYGLGSKGGTKRYLDSIPQMHTIDQINRKTKMQKINVVGKFDRKGTPKPTSTKYGESYTVTGFLKDDTAEIKCQLWGDIANTIKNGDILKLLNAYSRNGRLFNKKDGTEEILGST